MIPEPYNQAVVDYQSWIKANLEFGLSSDGEKKPFLPLGRLSRHWAPAARFRSLIRAVASNEVDPSTVRDGFPRIFTILLFIGHGSYMTHFIENRVTDFQLPLRQQFECLRFSEDLFLRFQTHQWQICAPMFDHDNFQGQRYTADEIMPIVEKEKVDEGGAAIVYRIKIHEDHDGFRKYQSADNSGAYDLHTYALKVYRGFNAKSSYRKERSAFRRICDQGKYPKDIVRYFGFYEHGDTYNLILELADKGNLEQYLQGTSAPCAQEDIEMLWKGLQRLLYALIQIHGDNRIEYVEAACERGFHQDIKPSNILVMSHGKTSPYAYQFKMGDLNTAHFIESNDPGQIQGIDNHGTCVYAPPECYRSDPALRYSKLAVAQNVDIWSLGCLWLEFAVWIVFNYEALRVFREERRQEAEDNHICDSGEVFHKHDSLLDTVTSMIERLREEAQGRQDWITYHMVEIIKNMISVAPEHRPKTSALIGQISAIPQSQRKSTRRISRATYQSSDRFRDPEFSHLPQAASAPDFLPSTPHGRTDNPAPYASPSGKGRPNPRFHAPISNGFRSTHFDKHEYGSNEFPQNSMDPSYTGGVQTSPRGQHDSSNSPLEADAAQGLGFINPGLGHPYVGGLEVNQNFFSHHVPETHRLPIQRANTAGSRRAPSHGSQNFNVYNSNDDPFSSSSPTSYGYEDRTRPDMRQRNSFQTPQRSPPIRGSSGYLETNRRRMLSHPPPTQESSSNLETSPIYSSPQLEPLGDSPFQQDIYNATSDTSNHRCSTSMRMETQYDASVHPDPPRRREIPKCTRSELEQYKAKTKAKRTIWGTQEGTYELPHHYLLKDLDMRDHVFVLDNSCTMKPHWPDVVDLTSLLTWLVKKQDKNGLDLWPTVPHRSHENTFTGIKTSTEMKKIAKTLVCKHTSDITLVLSDIWDDYKATLCKASDSMFTGPPKPMMIYIFTDGDWAQDSDPIPIILDMVKTLQETHRPSAQLGIQFVRWGNSEEGKRRLERLDRLQEYHPEICKGEFRDIVDSMHVEEDNIWKMLFGPTNKLFDDD